MRRRLIGPVVLVAVLITLLAVAALGILADGFDLGEVLGQEPDSTEPADLRALPEEFPDDDDVPAAPRELGGQPFLLCDGCHPNFEELPDETEDLIFSHPIHMEEEIACATCHDSPLAHFGQPAVMMMTCLSCHEGETAPNDCRNCHRRLEEIAPGLEEPVVHLSPDAHDRETCAKCHDVETWCERCHGLSMPHPAGWTEQHGDASLGESQVCEKCHQSQDPTFCIDCHEIRMPHPAYWFSNHGDIASENRDACDLCHPGAPQYCNSCHHAGWSPTMDWLPEEHGQAVEEDGTGGCFICHDEAFCADCHSAGRFVRQ